MIETTKWFKMEQVVKISWFAAILTSGFIYLNGGHIANKVKESLFAGTMNVIRTYLATDGEIS